MPSTLPRTVRQAIGDKAADEFEHCHNTESVMREEYRQVLSRLDALEHGMQGVQAELGPLRSEMREGFRDVSQRIDKQTRLILTALVGFATIISVLLAIAEFA